MTEPTLTVFQGPRRLLSGDRRTVLTYLKTQAPGEVLIFDDATGRQTDFDLSGTLEEVLAREVPPEKAGPGRPKLGVTAREVTLLPRHWAWLEAQRGGASATLRRLIDEERKRNPGAEAVTQAQQATDRFLLALAGDLPDYEEGARALYARDRERFLALSAAWPGDVRAHALHLAAPAFTPDPA
ncbi:hypothetical protein SAMN04488058_10762 [Deinococcus reticulitermitis]|uniref:DUF2239 domain-containing protein n=1 Tax=Deinococcus reticulitermitis TaxID=856736 RepID=A0A1H6YNN5_9DEIO|nr:DUF2239 family protein [Deinococcus reticulitermitis]SEJ38880.1 hypothetical protein SAMN04488058_10762 [Deinococcus reticulitermitis]